LRAQHDEADVAAAENEARRASPARMEQIMKAVRLSTYKTKLLWIEDRKKATAAAETRITEVRHQSDKAMTTLKERHAAEKELLHEHFSEERAIEGKLAQDMRVHVKAVKAFHQAVWDHPGDEWRNVKLEVYMRNLMDHYNTAELMDRSELARHAGIKESEVRKLEE